MVSLLSFNSEMKIVKTDMAKSIQEVEAEAEAAKDITEIITKSISIYTNCVDIKANSYEDSGKLK